MGKACSVVGTKENEGNLVEYVETLESREHLSL